MNVDLFGFLDGASPWWWIALALGLGAVEIVTFTYFMLWLGLASFSVGILLAILPDLPGTEQALIFAVLSIIYAAVGWGYLRRMQRPDEHPGLNRRSAALIGRQAIVQEGFRAGVGWVEVDGVRWRARLAEGAMAPEAGATMDVRSADGMTLVIGPAG